MFRSKKHFGRGSRKVRKQRKKMLKRKLLVWFSACFCSRKEASGGGEIASPGKGTRRAANVIPLERRERAGGTTALATRCVLLRITPRHLVYRRLTSDFSVWQAGRLLHLFLKVFEEQVHSCVCCDRGRERVLALCPWLCLRGHPLLSGLEWGHSVRPCSSEQLSGQCAPHVGCRAVGEGGVGVVVRTGESLWLWHPTADLKGPKEGVLRCSWEHKEREACWQGGRAACELKMGPLDFQWFIVRTGISGFLWPGVYTGRRLRTRITGSLGGIECGYIQSVKASPRIQNRIFTASFRQDITLDVRSQPVSPLETDRNVYKH